MKNLNVNTEELAARAALRVSSQQENTSLQVSQRSYQPAAPRTALSPPATPAAQVSWPRPPHLPAQKNSRNVGIFQISWPDTCGFGRQGNGRAQRAG